MNQNDMVLRYMRECGSITPWEALKEFGCMRLGARIYDLRRRGYDISKVMVTGKNRFGKNVTFARYTIACS